MSDEVSCVVGVFVAFVCTGCDVVKFEVLCDLVF